MGEMARLYLRRIIYLVGGCVLLTTLITLLPQAPARYLNNNERQRMPHSAPKRSSNSKTSRRILKTFDDTIGRNGRLEVPPPLPYARRLNDKSAEHSDEFLPSKQMAVGDIDRVKKDLETFSFDDREVDQDLVTELEAFWDKLREKNKPECGYNVTLAQQWKKMHGSFYSDRDPSLWDSYEVFYNSIDSCALYEKDEVVDKLLEDVSKWPVKHVGIMDGGTQVKLLITFDNGHKALWKPMRFGRYYESDENHFYFSDFERSVAEIGAFHLDRVLGFRRAIPTVGRQFNLSSEIRPFAERALNKTFFWSPAKNLCFVSKCDYYCDTTHAMCGKPYMKEGSLQVFLPNDDNVPRKHTRSIYRRTYSKRDQEAVWQKDMNYCNWKVKRKTYYAHGRRLLDLIDMHILDFLMGNQDRHHYESFTVFDNRVVYPLHMDNGRGFGRTDYDDFSILYPLTQCCVLRPSTYRRLLDFYANKPISLTQALHESLSKDPTFPIFPPKHYVALERRLQAILETIDQCIHKTGDVNSVLLARYDNTEISTKPTDGIADPTEDKKKAADADDDDDDDDDDDAKDADNNNNDNNDKKTKKRR